MSVDVVGRVGRIGISPHLKMAVRKAIPSCNKKAWVSALLLFLAPALVLGARFCLEKPVSIQAIPLFRRCRVLGFAHTPKTFPFLGKGNNLSSFSLTPNALGRSINEKALG